MRISSLRLRAIALLLAVLAGGGVAFAQDDDAGEDGIAELIGLADGGVSSAELLVALQDAAAAGQPIAAWRLGIMYENGEGVAKDLGKAFGYFSQIANDNADVLPQSTDADIVAQSFVKVGNYYMEGLPAAGIKPDPLRSQALIIHAASYFGDADAQFRLGQLYLTDKSLGISPIQSARWLSLAAHKGHVGAQATLGDMLFSGQGIAAKPVEGLMWLKVAQIKSVGTPDESWINALANRDMSIATADQRASAAAAADRMLSY